MMTRVHGRLESINTSDGGVPKTPRTQCRISVDGLQGDRQRDLRYHGGPDRAVCLYSLDRIRSLQGEGHPIAAGTLGENLTLSGVDWAFVVPGARVEVGEARLEVTAHAAPCQTIAGSFRDGEFVRVSAKVHPGWSRLYARVLQEGVVRQGDSARLVPSP